MFKRLLIGFGIALTLLTFAFVRSVRSAGELAPQVIDTAPLRGEELPLEGPIVLYFDQAMDQASVSAAFSIDPPVQGSLVWADDKTVSFKPAASLARAATYTIRLSEAAKNTTGTALRAATVLRLQTTGYLRIAQIVPSDGASEVEELPTITVIFNRPVVPLLIAEEAAKLPSPITIEPPIEGTGTWVNTSMYAFKPTKPLLGGMDYRVTAKAGLQDITGATLQEDVKSTFRIASPLIVEVQPEAQKTIALDQKISVVFSQPMDRPSVEAAWSFVNTAQNQPVAGTFKWNDAGTSVIFTPTDKLAYSTSYLLNINPQVARSVSGAAIVPLAKAVNYVSAGLAQLTNTQPTNGDIGVRSSGFTFNFSAPIDDKDFAKRVTVEPAPGLKFDDSSYETYEGSFVYEYGFSHEPSTSYTVTLDTTGLTDKYGTPLVFPPTGKYQVVGPNKLRFTFNTPDYDPSASLRTGSAIGVYSAYNATTRVYSTHRNIAQLDLSLWRVPVNDLITVVNRGDYYSNSIDYQPAQSNFLRQWSLKVENPLNVLRYDLLAVSDQGPSGTANAPSSFQCAGAPAPRMQVGTQGIVLADDPRPIRVREGAGLGNKQVNQLNPGVVFTILSGPQCSDGYIWWQIVTLDGAITGWVAEGDLSNYFIGPKDGVTQPNNGAGSIQFADNTATAPLAPGAYLLYFTAPALADSYNGNINHLMIVATANVTLKVTENRALAWITDMQSGLPVVGAPTQLFNKDGKLIGSGISDATGIVSIALDARLENLYTSLSILVDGNDASGKRVFGVASLNWDNGINTWDFGQNAEYYFQDLTAYIYSDRSLYRPGQPVYFRGVVRSRSDMAYDIPKLATIPVQVFNDQGEEIYRKELPLTPYGTFSDSFEIGSGASLGYYRIVAKPGTTFDDANARSFERGINVAQYRVPEFQVKLTPATAAVVQGDKISVQVESSYFFGGAVSNARVEWTVFSDPYFFEYKGSGTYNFINYNEDEGYRGYETGYGDSVAEGKGITDAQGRFTIEIPATLGKSGSSRQYTIEARVMDESDQLIAAREQIIVHQGQFYIGAAPEEYVGIANKPTNVNLITVGWDSVPVPNTALSLKVVERNWKSTQTVDPETGRTVWNWDVEEIPVTDGVATTGADGKAQYSFTPPKGGVYKVYATGRDANGNQITTSTFLWVAGPDYVPWRQQNSNRIDLKIDKTDYKVGDTASILIASPFQGATKALITVERGGILKTEVIDLPNNSTVYKLPITADMAPNAFFSVTVVKGVDATNPVAAFRMGLTSFGVEADRLKLNIAITPDKPQAGPREQVNYTIKVTDYAGAPVQAEVGVGLTDLAVLSLLPDTSTPILQHFYSKVGLGVRTASSLTQSVDQQTQEILNTIKGGGGGGPEGGIFEVRQRFIDTPLWSPNVVTDANGIAVVSVTLPDNLTTWRLDARAVTLPIGETQTTLVGQTTLDLISTKPLLIRPVTPRFFVTGDQGTLVAIVNNNSGAEQQVTARIEVKGAVLKDDASKSATIADRGRQRFEWKVEIPDVNAVEVTFFASSADGSFTDAAKSAVGQGEDKTLPVVKYQVPETVSTGGMITAEGGSRTEGISLPRRFDVQDGTLDIRVERSIASATTAALNVLEYYPYFCTEQTVSRFLPNVATYGALKRIGLDDPTLKAQLDRVLYISIQRLYADQKVDGGWGWFTSDQSNGLTTAYALIGLTEAKRNGFEVDERVINTAVAFLRGEVATYATRNQRWELNRSAFMQYALAYAGAGNFGQLVLLFNSRDQLSTYGRALLAMAFNLTDSQNTRYTDTLLSDFNNRAVLSANGAHYEEDFADRWNWNTDTRTTALVLKAMIQLQPANPLIPNIVRWLMIARRADSWETTQETAWAVLGLTDWMVLSGELTPNFNFDVTFNNAPLGKTENANAGNANQAIDLKVQVKDLLRGEINRLALSRTQGQGNLYYTANLTTYLPVEQVKALSKGVSIARRYSLANDATGAPITQAKVGDNIRVTLTITVPSVLHYVVITDPIPAGTESVDPGLNTSAVGQQPQVKLNNPLYDGWGWWYFSKTEFRDDRTQLYAEYLPEGTYQYSYTIRAGLPGVYKLIPAWGQEFYNPDVYARTDGGVFTLLPSDGNDPTMSK